MAGHIKYTITYESFQLFLFRALSEMNQISGMQSINLILWPVETETTQRITDCLEELNRKM